MQRLDPRVVSLWRLSGLVRLVTFWGPVLTAAAAFAGMRWGWTPALSALGGTLGCLAVLALLWPSLQWRAFGYEVREHDLLVRQGVLFRHTVSVPLSRIQHVDTRQGPLERIWGLSRLVVYTAAGMSADGSLPGLDEAMADHLRDELGRRGGDDGV
jgi:membrane protein YdbS with pleckstrin-like domain